MELLQITVQVQVPIASGEWIFSTSIEHYYIACLCRDWVRWCVAWFFTLLSMYNGKTCGRFNIVSSYCIFWSFYVIVFFASVIKAPKSAVLAGVRVGVGARARVCPGLYLKLWYFLDDFAFAFFDLVNLNFVWCWFYTQTCLDLIGPWSGR